MAGMKEWECKAERALGTIEGVAFGVSELVRDVILGAVEEVDDALKQYREELENLREDYKGQSKFVEILMKQKDGLLHENMELCRKLRGGDPSVSYADSFPCAGEPLGERIATSASGLLAMTDGGKITTSAAKPCNDEADCEGCGWVST